MPDKQRCLMIGAGGMARTWLQRFLPDFSDRLEVVGLVDVNPEPLAAAAQQLGLPATACFADTADALGQVDADHAIIVVPPQHHTPLATLCLEAGLDVLCEKPIASNWPQCVEMLAAMRRTARRVQIVQNYRYTQRILTIKALLAQERIGRINYVVARFAQDYRPENAWGAWRHKIPHSLLIEGGVHHLDQIRNLAGGDCATIGGFDWNPDWTSFAGESSALFTLTMANDVRAAYEGNCNEAGWQNPWHREYYRIEGESGAILVDNDNVVKLVEHTRDGGQTVTPINPVEVEYPDGHRMQIKQFLDWRLGGETPETELSQNLGSAAMLFGAIEASESGTVVDVAAMLAAAHESTK